MKRSETIRLFSTFFHIGDLPFAPGTTASAAGAAIAVLLNGHWFLYLVLTAAVTAAGFRVSGTMEKILKKKDPECVVIDEVSGVLIAFFLLPVTPAVVMTAFFLFRAFDMFKIHPADKFEAKGGSAGIMMDDIIAGIYTNLVMQIAVRLSGIA